MTTTDQTNFPFLADEELWALRDVSFTAMLKGEAPVIYSDSTESRDFTHVN